MDTKHKQFTLGDILVVPSRNEIEISGNIIKLQPKVMEVLVYLARHQERVIAKEELIEHVWRGRVVTDASVQKSINLLRKCLNEAIGDADVIAHYSKKGYQLQIQPDFCTPEPGHVTGNAFPKWRDAIWRHRILVIIGSICGILLVATGLILFVHAPLLDANKIIKSHQVQFNSMHGYTNELGHELMAEPHPMNEYVAYVRKVFNPTTSEMHSDLLVRNSKRKDWQFASSQGSWIEISWSPSGKSLAVVELLTDLSPGYPANASSPAIYDIHVFELDLQALQVVEKHRLSQWQGRISSLAWWDEETIELTAKQGESSVNLRYRYSLNSQRLNVVDPLEFVANPLLTRVHNKTSAIASLHKGATRVHFIGDDKERISSHTLPYRVIDMSWVPDGSGVVVNSEDGRTLSLVYLDGSSAQIELPPLGDKVLTRPRYAGDGKRIFFTATRPESDIWRYALDGSKTTMVDNSYQNHTPVFSPSGDRFAYVSVRNNQAQIWLVEGEQERELALSGAAGGVEGLSWTDDDNKLLYRSGATINAYDLQTGIESILLSKASDLIPFTVSADFQQLLAFRLTGEANNLWRVDLSNGEQKQLTFGSVGSARHYDKSTYFQYAGQQGLWVLPDGQAEISLVTREIAKHSELLNISNHGIYYVVDPSCTQSIVHYFAFESDSVEKVLDADQAPGLVAAFHPEAGALVTDCQLPEADIMVLE